MLLGRDELSEGVEHRAQQLLRRGAVREAAVATELPVVLEEEELGLLHDAGVHLVQHLAQRQLGPDGAEGTGGRPL